MSDKARRLAPVAILVGAVGLFWWSGQRPKTTADVPIVTTDSEFTAGLRKAVAFAEAPFKKADRNESLTAADKAALAKAADQFDALLDFRPREPGPFLGAGKAAYLLERYPDAEAFLRQAVINGDEMLKKGDREPSAVRVIVADARYERSRTLLALGRADEALTSVEEACVTFPENANFQTGRGSALMQLKRYSDAAAAFQTALIADPNHPVAPKLLDLALNAK